jgi:hypothetical protein
VIEWATRDEFWAPNILSPAKLRKQFPALLAKSRQRPLSSVHSNAEAGLRALEILNGGRQ